MKPVSGSVESGFTSFQDLGCIYRDGDYCIMVFKYRLNSDFRIAYNRHSR